MSLTADVAATLQPGFPGTDVPGWLVRAHAEGLVSVCLYGDNVAGPGGLAGLCAVLHERLPGALLAVDEEGGDVTRLHYPAGSTAVGNAVLGRLDDPGTTRAVAVGIGHELAELGIGLDLAPDVDVNSSPENPVIGVRSFGDDPALVARHAAAWVEGLQSTGVAACAKHFPGHGDTVVDSHHGLPRVDVALEVLRERELAPFRAAVDAGVAAVMTSHIIVSALDPTCPATFSGTVIGVLRDELGFDGVVVSDALDMAGASADTGIPEAAVRALAAGVDLLCLGSATTRETYDAVHAAIVSAVHAGRLPQGRVAEAAERVRSLALTTSSPRLCPTRPLHAPSGSATPRGPGWPPPPRSLSCRWAAPPTSPSAGSRGARPRWARLSPRPRCPPGLGSRSSAGPWVPTTRRSPRSTGCAPRVTTSCSSSADGRAEVRTSRPTAARPPWRAA